MTEIEVEMKKQIPGASWHVFLEELIQMFEMICFFFDEIFLLLPVGHIFAPMIVSRFLVWKYSILIKPEENEPKYWSGHCKIWKLVYWPYIFEVTQLMLGFDGVIMTT